MDDNDIKYFIEAALLAAGRPMSVEQLQNLFDGRSPPEKAQIRQAVSDLLEEYEDRGITISEVASGFRIEVKKNMADRLQKLWEGRSPRYSRALFETLALIAYRQPMTRGEIEEIRGVSVSTNIIRSLLEREWIRIVGHRDVPGRPAMFGTTKIFLDYFGLKQLDDLPPLADLSDWESLRVQLNLPAVDEDDVEVPTGEVTELPVLYPEGEAERAAADGDELPGSAAALDPDLEPIEATEWPDPSGGTTIIHTDPDGCLTVDRWPSVYKKCWPRPGTAQDVK
jgi:segregation and condensation protein B